MKLRKIITISTLGLSCLVFAGCSNDQTDKANSRTNNTSQYVNTHLQRHIRYFRATTYDKIHNRLVFHLKPQLTKTNLPIKRYAHLRLIRAKNAVHNPSLKSEIVKGDN